VSEVQLPIEEIDVRVSTGFDRLLRLPGATVIDVGFGAEGVIVTVRLRRRRWCAAAAARPADALRSTTTESGPGGTWISAPAVAESFFATIKKELVHRLPGQPARSSDARSSTTSRSSTNATRGHSTIGMLSHGVHGLMDTLST
jgi:hypothetical protein